MLTHPAEARRRFREYAEEEITNETLARGALLIALEDYPSIDVDHYVAQLDDLASRAESRCVDGEPQVFRLGHLHAEMFDVDGYDGDRTTYYDPRNAFLNEVIERRIGIPITLSIVYLHTAARLGLQASGVGLPGHFVVKVQFEINEIYVDPFQRGETLTMAELAGLLRQTPSGTQLASEHLRAWSGREILVRVLANLENMWARVGEPKRASGARERREMLAR